MTEDRMTALFFELFSGLPRQGPGDTASTLQALAMIPSVGPHTRILDVGCGSGAQTLVLARHSAARIVAVDTHPPFIEALGRRAEALGVADRIEARVGDMHQLDLPPASFDVVWCEGAAYVMGIESALRAWRGLLAPGGHVAFTEVCWTEPDPPDECRTFWAQEYPAIRNLPALLDTVASCGYAGAGHFVLPPSSWWDDYYRPLQQNVRAFRTRYTHDPDAQALADSVQREIDMWRAYSRFYSYAFVIARAA